MADIRYDEYGDLAESQLALQINQTRDSARRILKILFEYIRPESVLDVGSGLGVFLQVAQEMGVGRVRGIEGPWMNHDRSLVDPGLIHTCDLENSFSLSEKFDLAISMEVAEHLAPQRAEGFVSDLVNHADVVLFSAAVPFQGGCHHVNEQFADYWANLFSRHQFAALDFIRWRVWNDPNVLWWLRQNTLLFVHEKVIRANCALQRLCQEARPLSVVHPDIYLPRVQQPENVQKIMESHQATVEYLSQGGTFQVIREPGGGFKLKKIGSDGQPQ